MDSENDKLELYENSFYKEERIDRKTLIIKIENGDDNVLSGDINDIEIVLDEPLNIDKLSDIYLDSFVTLNAKPNNTVNNIGFLISIKEFNINCGTNISSGGNKIYIPNENSVNTSNNFHKVHKGKKLNYICQINPTKLKKLTLKITAMDRSSTAFNPGDPSSNPVIPDPAMVLEFVIISRK